MVKVSYKILSHMRKLKRYSTRALALESGISISHISDIEQGRSHPTVLVMCKLACTLGVRPEELFTYECEVKE